MNGVVYLAYGWKYIEEARQSLVSLREHTKLSACVISSVAVSGFDYSISVRQRGRVAALINKPYCLCGALEQLPFDKFLLLDTDTAIIGDITPVFGLLPRFDILVTHSQQRYTGPGALHTPMGYVHFNTGAIWFNRSKTMEFIRDWAARTYQNRGIYGNNDQPAFGEALYQGGLNTYILPPEFNLKVANRKAFASGPVYILHGRHNRLKIAMDGINNSKEPRVWDGRNVDEL